MVGGPRAESKGKDARTKTALKYVVNLGLTEKRKIITSLSVYIRIHVQSAQSTDDTKNRLNTACSEYSYGSRF